ISSVKIFNMKQSKASQNKKNMSQTFVNALLLSSIPYVLFLIGLTVLSLGFFRYVENESVLSLFLDDRGRAVSINTDLPNWNENLPSNTPGSVILTNPTKAPDDIEPMQSPEPVNTEPARLIVPFYYIGDEIGTLTIPSVNVEVKVFQGDREAEFRLGAGHYPGSYFPGQGNNILIAAHRTTYFKNLETLEVGDSIEFNTTYGIYNYIVEEIRIIDGNDNSVAGETDREQLTLYTCYPFNYFGNAPNRFVVIAGLEGNQDE
ncbi:MAG: class D sortase, partial [Clostridia bacterium]|nr:class D sortase [Clostridia bacterium]